MPSQRPCDDRKTICVRPNGLGLYRKSSSRARVASIGEDGMSTAEYKSMVAPPRRLGSSPDKRPIQTHHVVGRVKSPPSAPLMQVGSYFDTKMRSHRGNRGIGAVQEPKAHMLQGRCVVEG